LLFNFPLWLPSSNKTAHLQDHSFLLVFPSSFNLQLLAYFISLLT
jgi:hypothetical protein